MFDVVIADIFFTCMNLLWKTLLRDNIYLFKVMHLSDNLTKEVKKGSLKCLLLILVFQEILRKTYYRYKMFILV